MSLTAEHRQYLVDHAITNAVIDASGIRSRAGANPGIEFPWNDGTTEIVQFRPDTPTADDNGRMRKYLFPKGSTPVLNRLKSSTDGPVVLCEGTKQQYAVLSHVPPTVGVYGLSGCWGWKGADLSWSKGLPVYVLFDGDLTSNPDVYNAASKLGDALTEAGALYVRFVRSSARGKDGVDDALSQVEEWERPGLLTQWLSESWDKLPAPPAADPSSVVVNPKGPNGKPVIHVGNQALASEWLREEIGTGPLACLFRREDGLVHTPRIGEDGYLEAPDAPGRRSPAQVRRITLEQVKALIEYRYDVTKTVSKEGSGDAGKGQPKERVGTFFPAQALASVVNSAVLGEGADNLRYLSGVTHTPVMRCDGSILDAPGYDDAAGLLFLPEGGMAAHAVPDAPTPEQVREAVRLILTPVEEFDFVEEHHRANWVGLMLTPVLRQLLPPPYQMGVFTAPKRGSGKTLLADLIMTVHGGETRTQPDADPSKFQNEILAVLTTTTAPVITFDNIRGKLGSVILEKMLTDGMFAGRKLGETLDLQVPNDRLWLATSNNATIGGDMDRRIRVVKINPRHDRPEERTGFRLDPKSWITEHRGEYLAALLTVARGWILAGAPTETVRSDSYATWIGSLRGMLKWAGVPGLFAGDDVSEEVTDEDSEEWSAFLVEAQRLFGEEQFTVADLLALAAGTATQGPFGQAADPGKSFDPTCLPAEFLKLHGRDLQSASAKVSLGKFFGYRLESTLGGLSLECTSKSKKRANRYAIVNHKQ